MNSHAEQGQGSAGSWRASGIVSLLTDFGHVDPYVGVMKAVMLGVAPTLRLVDLTHEIPPQDIATAGWMLAQSWRWFPLGSVHLAVVDPGVGSRREILLAEQEGHAFLAPDNGLLDACLGAAARVWVLDVERFALPGRSATFHGRDIFSPAAAAIAAGLAPRAAARDPQPATRRERAPRGAALVWHGADRFETPVLHVDVFGNLISALVPEREGVDIEAFELELGEARVPTCSTYAEVEPGQLLALVDSYGHLEVAVRDGDARARLSLERGDRLTFRRRT